jgi:hypothetical protein
MGPSEQWSFLWGDLSAASSLLRMGNECIMPYCAFGNGLLLLLTCSVAIRGVGFVFPVLFSGTWRESGGTGPISFQILLL